MNLLKQKEIASRKLKIGKSRIHINPDNSEDIKEAITGEDIRKLVSEGLIKIKKLRGQSRSKARTRDEQKKKGRQKGHGKRKGTENARLSKKDKWMTKIRSHRKELKNMIENEKVTKREYRQLYIYAKSGIYRSKKHMNLSLAKMRESGDKK